MVGRYFFTTKGVEMDRKKEKRNSGLRVLLI